MARQYHRTNYRELRDAEIRRTALSGGLLSAGVLGAALSPLLAGAPPALLLGLGFLPAAVLGSTAFTLMRQGAIERERSRESALRGGKEVLGMPPERDCFEKASAEARASGK